MLILTPIERTKIIESKRKENMTAIDRVHCLYHLWKKGTIFSFEKSLSPEERILWASDSTVKTLEYLCEIEKDKTYRDIIEFLRKRWAG